MSNDVVIKVENLSKQYRLGLIGGKTLREDVNRWWAKLRGKPDPLLKVDQLNQLSVNRNQLLVKNGSNRDNKERITDNKSPDSDYIWALRNINFEVKQGEILGIIGKNGAGKSTLLKILTKITAPTYGEARLKGRVGSLLEVGTGFHPELTGIENIYLNGAILGMTKAEVNCKLDEIIEFAEIEKFADTPVKRYSSGMYVRLAFAVAAHLEPEILLVDEVLAVGDAAFQKKCLGKMDDVARKGRTVLFVSHNMATIQKLCNSGILLNQGQIAAVGSPSEVGDSYLQDKASACLEWRREFSPSSDVCIQRVYLTDESGRQVQFANTRTSLRVVTVFMVKRRFRNLQLSVGILDSIGDQIFGTRPADIGLKISEQPGQYRAILHLPPEIFLPKRYGIKSAIWAPDYGVLDMVDSLRFTVHEVASFASTPEGRPGHIAIRCAWQIHRSDS